MRIDKTNYSKCTIVDFKKVNNAPNKKPDYISYQKLNLEPITGEDIKVNSDIISSEYWFSKDGLYRKSDHWGFVGNCYWGIDKKELIFKNPVIGFAKWNDCKTERQVKEEYHILLQSFYKKIRYFFRTIKIPPNIFYKDKIREIKYYHFKEFTQYFKNFEQELNKYKYFHRVLGWYPIKNEQELFKNILSSLRIHFNN